eukprot:1299360-Pyramimonas_sp.AAC.1
MTRADRVVLRSVARASSCKELSTGYFHTWKQLSYKTKMKAAFAVPVASLVFLLLPPQGILLDMLEGNE